jgi:hypothetical protein
MPFGPTNARFLFIIHNSRDQFTVHSLQFIVKIKNALTVNRRLSTVNLYCQSSVVRWQFDGIADQRQRWAHIDQKASGAGFIWTQITEAGQVSSRKIPQGAGG